MICGRGEACEAAPICIDFPEAILAEIAPRVLNIYQEGEPQLTNLRT